MDTGKQKKIATPYIPQFIGKEHDHKHREVRPASITEHQKLDCMISINIPVTFLFFQRHMIQVQSGPPKAV